MGVAALVLGIISIIVGFIPFCGAIAFIPAVIGLILGIIDTVKKSKSGEKKAISIVGLVLSAVAIVIITLWTLVFSAIIATVDVNDLDLDDDYSSYNYRNYSYYNY